MLPDEGSDAGSPVLGAVNESPAPRISSGASENVDTYKEAIHAATDSQSLTGFALP
jgi:hypothetical protein